MEPLNVAIHSCRRANLVAGQTLLVLGAGITSLIVFFTEMVLNFFHPSSEFHALNL